MCRSGGRTYNIPNYATRFVFCIAVSSCPELKTSSYANEKSSVISVIFDEHKGTPKTVITILVVFLLLIAIPIVLMALNSTEKSVSTTNFHHWSKEQVDRVRKKKNFSQLDFIF